MSLSSLYHAESDQYFLLDIAALGTPTGFVKVEPESEATVSSATPKTTKSTSSKEGNK